MALQAATMVAMRSAYDNSVEVSDNLTLEISRKRQASVTEGVIETASAMNAEDL
jgi:F0F1-type ATP synthase gamma subunit